MNKQYRYQNTKLSLIIKIIIIFIAIFIAFLLIKKIKYSSFLATTNLDAAPVPPDTTKQPADNFSASLDSFLFEQDTSGTREIGQVQTISEDTANTYCTIYYPLTGMDSIDAVLKQEADNILSEFNNRFAGYSAPAPESRAYLSVDYQSYVTGDSIASFIYNIQYNSPDQEAPVQEVRTHTFFLSTGNEINTEHFLAGDYLKLFSYNTARFIDANPEFYNDESENKEKYEDSITAASDNFKEFSISMNGLSLYFNPGRIAPEKFNCVSFTIPTDEILPYCIYDPFKEVTLPQNDITAPDASVTPGPAVIDPSKPMIALTFDDGPNKGSTERILDTLEKYGVHATFFMVGNRINYNKDIVKRAYELGCDVGSHSYDHGRLTEMKKKNIKKEFSKTNDILKDLIGDTAHYVRTPYGSHTKYVLSAVKYPVILWNVDTEDWKSRNKKKIVKKVIGKVNDGDIVLMHDIYDSTADAIEIIIPKLIEQGFQIVSISEMFEAKGINPQKGTVYYNIR